MSKRNVATGCEKTFIKSWEGWDGDGLDWMYFYNVELNPATLRECVERGYSPTTKFHLELCMNDMHATVMVEGEDGNDVPVVKLRFKLFVTGKE